MKKAREKGKGGEKACLFFQLFDLFALGVQGVLHQEHLALFGQEGRHVLDVSLALCVRWLFPG